MSVGAVHYGASRLPPVCYPIDLGNCANPMVRFRRYGSIDSATVSDLTRVRCGARC